MNEEKKMKRDWKVKKDCRRNEAMEAVPSKHGRAPPQDRTRSVATITLSISDSSDRQDVDATSEGAACGSLRETSCCSTSSHSSYGNHSLETVALERRVVAPRTAERAEALRHSRFAVRAEALRHHPYGATGVAGRKTATVPGEWSRYEPAANKADECDDSEWTLGPGKPSCLPSPSYNHRSNSFSRHQCCRYLF